MSNLCPHSLSKRTLAQSFHVQAEVRGGIRDFRQLRELELTVERLGPPHQLLPSITSLELQKVIFSVGPRGSWDILAGLGEWTLIDRQLCELVDRLRVAGYCYTLEVELRITKAGDDPAKYDFSKFLSKFREKGVVTVVDAFQGRRILHSSVRSH